MVQDTDEHWMRQALVLARKGSGFVHPNPLVGAVLVRDGQRVGYGWHQKAGTAHAEVHALEKAGAAARGATLYVNLEPCNHHGQTPPCTQAILRAGVRRVVYGSPDPNPRVAGGGADWLRNAGVEVDGGVLRAQCDELNATWLHWVRTGEPFVVLKLAISSDGKVDYGDGHLQWISGPVARAHVQRLRRHCDAILVGSGTILSDDPRLTNRSGRGRQPLRVIVDSRLRVSPSAKVFQPSEFDQFAPAPRALVAVSHRANPAVRGRLEKLGVEVVELNAVDGRVDLRALFRLLGKRGVQSVLCEGGPKVASSIMRQRLCHRVALYQAPMIIGDRGRPYIEPATPGEEATPPALSLLWSRRIGPDILSVYTLL